MAKCDPKCPNHTLAVMSDNELLFLIELEANPDHTIVDEGDLTKLV